MFKFFNHKRNKTQIKDKSVNKSQLSHLWYLCKYVKFFRSLNLCNHTSTIFRCHKSTQIEPITSYVVRSSVFLVGSLWKTVRVSSHVIMNVIILFEFSIHDYGESCLLFSFKSLLSNESTKLRTLIFTSPF